ncbi:hypothetical protein WEI85_46955 [Actinomycetes bacterium KLBMP 9797]
MTTSPARWRPVLVAGVTMPHVDPPVARNWLADRRVLLGQCPA